MIWEEVNSAQGWHSLRISHTYGTTKYSKDKCLKTGNHIYAQYDEDCIVVYQAYKPSIAEYAVKNKQFGGDEFSFDRMSWIKTNYSWMLYRCGYATKKNQERVLAIKLKRSGFEQLLSWAWTAQYEKAAKKRRGDLLVRLQWDPDYTPRFHKLERRAIQLGMKGKALREYSENMIVDIQDITDFVKEQKAVLDTQGVDEIEVAEEQLYTAVPRDIAEQIELSEYGEQSPEISVN